jgi:hypothetical protein
MKKNDIVTVLTTIGEMVGRFVEENETTVTISSPKMFVNSPQGMGFAPGICISSCPKSVSPIVFQKTNVIALVPTVKEIADAWVQSTTGLVLSS